MDIFNIMVGHGWGFSWSGIPGRVHIVHFCTEAMKGPLWEHRPQHGGRCLGCNEPLPEEVKARAYWYARYFNLEPWE